MIRRPIAQLIIPAVMASLACSNTFNFQDQAAEGPILYFGKDTTRYKDSIKVYFTIPVKDEERVPLKFSITPDKVGSLQEITVMLLGGSGILKAGGKEVMLTVQGDQGDNRVGAFPAEKGVRLPLSFLPHTNEGKANYNLIFAPRSAVTKEVSKTHISTLTVATYKNLPPVAKLKIINGDSKYNFQFDASASYDQDGIYGGKVVAYTYTVTGPSSYKHEFTVNQKNIPYSFPSTGIYTVSLQVKDNDKAVSFLPFVQQVTIQE